MYLLGGAPALPSECAQPSLETVRVTFEAAERLGRAGRRMSKRPTDHLEPAAKKRGSERQLTKDDASDEEVGRQ